MCSVSDGAVSNTRTTFEIFDTMVSKGLVLVAGADAGRSLITLTAAAGATIRYTLDGDRSHSGVTGLPGTCTWDGLSTASPQSDRRLRSHERRGRIQVSGRLRPQDSCTNAPPVGGRAPASSEDARTRAVRTRRTGFHRLPEVSVRALGAAPRCARSAVCARTVADSS